MARGLGEELAALERTNPVVGAAARSYDQMVERINSGAVKRSHPLPCQDDNCPWHQTIADLG